MGVPLITQAGESANPAGNPGTDVQLVIMPPVLRGGCDVIADPVVNAKGVPAYPILGATSLTVTEIVADDDPPELVAVIV